MEGSDILTRMEKSIEIKAPPERVWEMLAFDRLPEWQDGLEVMGAKYISEVRAPEDKYRVGASAHITEKRWEYELEVTESLKNEKITHHSKGKYAYTSTYILKPIEVGTELTWVGDMSLGVIGGFLMKLAGEKQIGRALEKLKGILEK